MSKQQRQLVTESSSLTRRTTETRPPLHFLVWRRGLPTVVSCLADGVTEFAERAFDSDHAALAHLAILQGVV